MNKIALCTLAIVATATASTPAHADRDDRDVAVKCVAEYVESRWPWRATTPYVPDNTQFRFVCPGVSGARTIPQLYQLDYSMIGLPFKEPAPGNAVRYVVWLER